MKTVRLLASLFLILLLAGPSLKASDLYILYDPSCMDRLEYDFQGRTGAFDYVTYHVNVNANEKVILELGNETEQSSDYLPSQFITCRNANFDRQLVAEINRGYDRVFLVRQTGRRNYIISQVNQAAYYRYDGQMLTYQSPEFSFEFNLRSGVVGEDISMTADAQSEVYFEGMLMKDCTGAYIFRQYSPRSSAPHTDQVIIPEIGIVEERTGFNAEDAFNNILKLASINGKAFDNYLYELCNGRPPMETTPAAKEFTTKSPEVTTFENTSSPTAPRPQPAAATGPCGKTPGPGYHAVAKGETLYRIAKQYDASVSQIKSWNGLTSNMIYPCDMLRVFPEGSLPAPAEQSVAADRRMPAPYENTDNRFTAKGETGGQDSPAWESGKTYHVVQRGETVPYLAMKYGFTETRFRDMNNLGPDEHIKIGEVIKTCDCPIGRSERTTPPAENNTTGRRATDLSPRTPAGYDYYNRPAEVDESRYGAGSTRDLAPIGYQQPESRISTRGGSSSVSASLADRMGGNTYRDSTTPQEYEAETAKDRIIHQVREGETLRLISQIYGVSTGRLRELNNLGPNEVVIPNQRLYIN